MSQEHAPHSHSVVCPVCGQGDQVEKVSTLYLAGIEARRLSKASEASLAQILDRGVFTAQELSRLSQRLSPPASGKKEFSRPLHPDLMVLVFSCIAPIFLYGILAQQSGWLLPILGLLALMYGVYFYQRKALIARYESRRAAQHGEQAQIEKGIAIWMKLYYCAREDGVFLPGKKECIAVDQMMGYVLHS